MRSLLNLEDGNTVTLDKNGLRSSACIQEACRQARQEKAQWRHKGLAGLRWLLIWTERPAAGNDHAYPVSMGSI